MQIFRKKQVVLFALVAMVALAGYLNWSYTDDDKGMVADSPDNTLGQARLVSGTNIKEAEQTPAPSPEEVDYFSKSRLEKETGRSKATETLNSLIKNDKTSDTAKSDAEAQLLSMAKKIEQETSIEAQLRAKGFLDCVVYINDDSVSVIVKTKEGLTGNDALKIQEIVVSVSGVSVDKIKITEQK